LNEVFVTRSEYLCMLVAIALLDPACLTIRVATHATNPHPSFSYLSTVSGAAVRDGELFLRLEVLQGKLGETHRATIVGKVQLEDLRQADAVAADPDTCRVDALRKVPIRLQRDPILPADTSAVPIRELILRDQGELAEVVSTLRDSHQILLIHPKPGGPLHRLYTKCCMARGDPGGPYVAVVFPSTAARPTTALMQDFDELPRTRRTWWLLTPFSVLGDIVTSPLQLLYILAWD
jgi:hypothetical protein